jgi:gamma-glutamylcyclotransferase (GGCT)/AIG2-like uncharacterized protein YtfP
MEELPPGRCWLFAYGLLQPGIHPPRSVRRSFRDGVRGRLFALADYPAAVEIGRAAESIEGFTMDIAEAELGHLDDFEGVREGLYRRLQTMTDCGAVAWVYEYLPPLPCEARGPLTQWPVEQSPSDAKPS